MMGKRILSTIIKYHMELIIPILAICIFLSFASDHFLNVHNFNNVGNQIAINLIIGLGMTLIVCSGGIDLSVGSIVGLAGVVTAVFFQAGASGPLAPLLGVLIGLAVGVGVGLVNGVIVSYLKVPPFICTLGMMISVRGLCLIFSGGRPIMGMPDEFISIFAGFLFGIPKPVITAALAAVVTAFLLNKTTLGRLIQALGGSEKCVRACGISVNKLKITIFCISGLFSGLAGLALLTTMATAEPLGGTWYELEAIAVVVMGGTKLDGGKGTILGTVLGAVLLGFVRNGLNILGIHATYHTLIVGIMILIAIILGSQKVLHQKAFMLNQTSEV